MKKLLLIALFFLCFSGFSQDINQEKYEKALLTLKSDPSNSTARGTLESLIVKNKIYDTEETNYAIVNAYLERGRVTHYINDYINRLIELKPNNNDYRLIRVRCNMTSMSDTDDFNKAIDDLKFMISNGGDTAIINMNLGMAYTELGRLTPKSTNQASLKEYYSKIIENYTNAIASYKRALEIDSTADVKFKIKMLEKDIEELKTESGL